MCLSPKRCGQRLIAGVVLGLLMTASGVAQTTQQEEGPPPVWTVNCLDNQGKLDCRAVQSAFDTRTGQRVLAVAVRVLPESKKPVLMVEVPLGVYLPAGASVQIGKDKAKVLPFKGCYQAGCVADYDITESEISAMTKGSDLKISVQNQAQKPAFDVTIPVTGFADAYAKVK